MDKRGSFLGDKAAEAWSWPLTSGVKECMELYLHSLSMLSRRGAQFKKNHRDNYIFTLTRMMSIEKTEFIIDVFWSHNKNRNVGYHSMI
jgi:hypothetical protein